MKIELNRIQLDTLTGSLTLDILNSIEARKACKTELEYDYWTRMIKEISSLRKVINNQTVITG